MIKSTKITIILAAAFFTTTLFNYYWLHMVKGGELKIAVMEKEAKENEYNELKQLADGYEELAARLTELKKEYYNRDKVLPSLEDSRVSFAYFNSLLRMPGDNVN